MTYHKVLGGKQVALSSRAVIVSVLPHLGFMLRLPGWSCALQIFDSWGGQLPPREWERWSGPYLKRIVQVGGGGGAPPAAAWTGGSTMAYMPVLSHCHIPVPVLLALPACNCSQSRQPTLMSP
jgi:hypothetical protein